MARKWQRQGQPITAIVRRDLRARSHFAVAKATQGALVETRRTIRGVGLGRLANAVGSYNSLELGDTNRFRAYGAIFARGPSRGRGNQALLAYSEGATILPTNGRKWLAFSTNAIPKRIGPRKITPELYSSSSLVQSIGKLHFVAGKSGRVAFLVARQVTQSRRTGRIKAAGARVPRGSDLKKSVIAFILIRFTRRAQRFNQAQIMIRARDAIPAHAARWRPA
jgi:hypothetical protein